MFPFPAAFILSPVFGLRFLAYRSSYKKETI